MAPRHSHLRPQHRGNGRGVCRARKPGVGHRRDHIILTICQGEIFGFLGHNGAGKTTTIRLLNGVLEPSDGAARVLGMVPLADGPTLRRRTGVLTETPSLDERLTGRENLTIYADLYGVPPQQVAPRVADLLATFDLSDRAEEKVSGYSKMKQRLALARALLHEPEILFLGEPTSGLDPVATRQVHRLITRLSREQGRTVFMCTHNLAEAQALCDRVGVMENGRLLAIGAPAELMQQMQKALRLELEVAEKDRETVLNQFQPSGDRRPPPLRQHHALQHQFQRPDQRQPGHVHGKRRRKEGKEARFAVCYGGHANPLRVEVEEYEKSRRPDHAKAQLEAVDAVVVGDGRQIERVPLCFLGGAFVPVNDLGALQRDEDQRDDAGIDQGDVKKVAEPAPGRLSENGRFPSPGHPNRVRFRLLTRAETA